MDGRAAESVRAERGTTLVVVLWALVALSALDPRALVETGAFDVQSGGFSESPFAGGLLNVHLGESHAEEETGAGGVPSGFALFAGAILILGTIGALIESVIVGAVAAFIARVRPALLGLGAAPAAPVLA